MPLFDASDLPFVETVSKLISCNPFLSEWIELERQALGPAFHDAPRRPAQRGEWDLDDVHPYEEDPAHAPGTRLTPELPSPSVPPARTAH